MNPKTLYLLGAGVGGTIASFIPVLWHAGGSTGWGILFSTIGGLAGIWATHRYLVS